MDKGQTLGWIAIVISVIALIFAWTAFNRAGEDFGDVIQQEVQEAMEEINDAEVDAPATDEQSEDQNDNGLLNDQNQT